MFQRINTSLPKEDLDFCKSRDLKPSKLLQERITQIRDEANPTLQKNLKEEREHSENIRKKLEYSSTMFQKLVDSINKKLGEEEGGLLLDEIIG